MMDAGTCKATMETFAEFRGRHEGTSFLVCGCGESLNGLTARPDCITIGVNDIGRLLDPEYLVVVNPPAQFSPERYRHIEQSKARTVFSQYPDLPLAHAPLVQFALGTYNGTDFSDPRVLHHTRNSPYVAIGLAIHMGAKCIGLIGVDFTDNHFFAATGRHPLASVLGQIDREYRNLAAACARVGIAIYNLSPISRLAAFPRRTLEEFAAFPHRNAAAKPADGGLRIVSYATTPIAGVPAILARCITARTRHTARCVWATNDYGNGVFFDGDLEWTAHPTEAEAALVEADLVIVHNGKLEDRHRAALASKPVVTMAHNYLWNVDTGLVRAGFPGVVVGQYQATLPEFAGWGVVPNPVPLWERAFTPEPKGDTVRIAYTPSGRHESYPESHRLYWHGKGYETTMRVLDTLARRYPIEVTAVRDRQMSHAEALAAKRRAHIVIDECVTGSYHRNSLEGLACGTVVVNGVGMRDGVVKAFNNCSDGTTDLPFVRADRDTLEPVLAKLIEAGPSELSEIGRCNRVWMEKHWDFAQQWNRLWQPVIDRAIRHSALPERSAVPVRKLPRSGSVHVAAPQPPISIVIPHRGGDRLPQLRYTLLTLSEQLPEAEIVVAEMGPTLLAADLVHEIGGIHIAMASRDVFERARALNAGSVIASHELIVWQDNDLVPAPGFFARAVEEFQTRGLDYLIPYTQISYLSASDTAAVLHRAIVPDQCHPVRTLRSGRDASGGMGIVRRQFLDRFGGFSQEFRGWGGEDNFWWKKATLLGRAGTTQRSDQHLWHLFHDDCGALTGRLPLESAHYRRNVALLGEVRRIGSPTQFCARFPFSRDEYCPFDGIADLRFLAVGGTASMEFAIAVKTVLDAFYELPITLDDPDTGNHHEGAGIVTFGNDALTRLAGRTSGGSRPVLCHVARADEIEPLSRAELTLGACSIITDAAPGQVSGFERPVFSWIAPRSIGSEARRAAVALVQALSQALPALSPSAEDPAPARDEMAVWLYWEGDLPEWIERCHATILAHAPGARLLDRTEFELIWDRDRDIDISRLVPAQRADFVRAFLLWRHGGIWIDSDCLLMRGLEEVQRLLARYDFVAHRDRQGFFPNGFIGAADGSRVAAELYRRVCERLRSGRPLGWISLGGELLTQILRATPAEWYELPCERIQPICWSRPEAFFDIVETATHEVQFDPQAMTYMLSYTKVTAYQRENPGKNLLSDGTFFRFLLARSLGEVTLPPKRARDVMSEPLEIFSKYHRAALLRRDESLSGPGSSTARTLTLRRTFPDLLRVLGVRALLDAGCGDFNWMRQLDLQLEHYFGIDIIEDLITRNRRRHGGPRWEFLCLDLVSADLPRADAVLCRDTLVHYSLVGAQTILRNLQRSGARFLIATTFPGRGANKDIPLGGWRPLDMQGAPFNFPSPLRLINENCTEMDGRYADKSLAVWALQQLELQAPANLDNR
jgi:hypothetical protein